MIKKSKFETRDRNFCGMRTEARIKLKDTFEVNSAKLLGVGLIPREKKF